MAVSRSHAIADTWSRISAWSILSLRGLYRRRDEAEVIASSPIGRSLEVYADCFRGAV